ncbi:DUF4230 domain-containing protein [Laspinema olomoucense]|uniref:DUF4230 domain-containing protein n=1 Tax=Laspinema olomoucense D3b TaxID=2953688 RepID=A0ABT2N8M3_9CYAN|nr:DUF4230 domain-containing protein [Laspinema sp. D3b]MCT7978826.1 DUF4230 domain-containing protein [Laspinema sp. D3b]
MNSSTSKRNQLGKVFENPLFQKIILTILGFFLIQVLLFQLSGAVRSTLYVITHVLLPSNQTTVEIRNIIIGGLHDINELTTTEMSTKATVDFKEDRIFFGRIPFGDTHVVYEAVGTVQAGIDLDQLDVKKIDVAKHKVRLVLPPPRLMKAFLDVEGSHVVVHFRRWFGRPVESDLQEQAQREALALIKKEACANKILDNANQQAKKLVENILHSSGYQEVIIDTQPPGINSCQV